MEPDSSLSWSRNARIELLHTVEVHLSSDFMINFIFCASWFLKLSLQSSAIWMLYKPSSPLFLVHILPIFYLILFNLIYFSKGRFVKFITMHFYPNSSYLVHLNYKYYPLYFIFKLAKPVFFAFHNGQRNKCL